MSAGEIPESPEFKSLRITLSEEAFDRMEKIMKGAAFRSYSATIEECIRTIHDLMEEIYAMAGRRGTPNTHPTALERSASFDRIVMKMNRFTGRGLVAERKE